MKKITIIIIAIMMSLVLSSCKKDYKDKELTEYDLISGEYVGTLCYKEEGYNPWNEIFITIRNNKLYMSADKMKLRSKMIEEGFFEDDYVEKDNYEFPKLYYYCVVENTYYYIMRTKTSDIYIHMVQIVDEKNHIVMSYKLTRYSDLVSDLPLEMPEGFSFYMYTTDTFNFSSSSGELRVFGGKNAYERGYINLTKEELKAIYQILRAIKIDKVPYNVFATEDRYLDANSMEIRIKYGDYFDKVIIDAPKNPRNRDWVCYEDFKNSFYKVYDDFIASNPVYKELEAIIANDN